MASLIRAPMPLPVPVLVPSKIDTIPSPKVSTAHTGCAPGHELDHGSGTCQNPGPLPPP